MTIRAFLHLPPPGSFSNFSDVTIYVRRLWDAIFRLRQGKMECTGEITLTINAATTTLNRNGISMQTVIHFDPKTANAAAEIYGGTMYVLTANRVENTFTITHANNALADRTFIYTAIG